MHRRARRALGSVESYALALAGWYVLVLTLGIPTLPPAGHVAGAVAFGAILVGATVAAARLDAGERRRTVGRLSVGFVLPAVAVSVVVGFSTLTVEAFTSRWLLGRALISVVGACLFTAVVVGVVTLVRALVGGRPAG